MVSSMCSIKRLAIFRAAASLFDFRCGILEVYSHYQSRRNIGLGCSLFISEKRTRIAAFFAAVMRQSRSQPVFASPPQAVAGKSQRTATLVRIALTAAKGSESGAKSGGVALFSTRTMCAGISPARAHSPQGIVARTASPAE